MTALTPPRVPWPGGVRLRHVKQLLLGTRTASRDCGTSGLLMTLQAASGAALRPAWSDFDAWVRALRAQMPHGPTWPSTRLSDLRAAVLSELMDGAFLSAGAKRRPVSGVVVLEHEEIVELLEQGRAVEVAIDYGRLNDLMPELSGSPTYRGGHAITLVGFARQGRQAWTHLGDPLHDGRRPGIPKGWQTVRIRRYLRAAETWGGVGHGRAAVLWLAPAEELR